MLRGFHLNGEQLDPSIVALRQEVRDFIAAERASGGFKVGPGLWLRFDPNFSEKLGRRGWVGMTFPKQYGGHGLSALHRYVVTEELLASGAPLRAHWIADRQVGPNLLKFGSEFQKKELLPRIAAGQCYFCVGLSEPNAGSDLASMRTRAVRAEKDNGWVINGRKIWTSIGHRAHYMNLLARTGSDADDRRGGVTQFILDMKSPGVTIRPIINMLGEHDFNEVEFQDVFIPDEWVVGTVGNAWNQLSTELAYERSGSDRWLGSFGLMAGAIDRVGKSPSQAAARLIGAKVAELYTLHRMSFGLGAMLERGETPVVEASIAKDLGTHFEKSMPDLIEALVDEMAPDAMDEGFADILRYARRNSTTMTVKGGAREILRGIIARDLGLR